MASPAASVPPPSEATFKWVMQLVIDFSVAECRVYSFGSLFDGSFHFGGLCARLGWAFVVITSCGNVAAAANRVPPPLVRSILGAELRAVLMAATQFGAGTSYCVD